MTWRLRTPDLIAFVTLGASLAVMLDEALRVHAHWILFWFAAGAAIASAIHLSSLGLPEEAHGQR